MYISICLNWYLDFHVKGLAMRIKMISYYTIKSVEFSQHLIYFSQEWHDKV